MVNDAMFRSAKQISAQAMNRNNEKNEQINEQGQEGTQTFFPESVKGIWL